MADSSHPMWFAPRLNADVGGGPPGPTSSDSPGLMFESPLPYRSRLDAGDWTLGRPRSLHWLGGLPRGQALVLVDDRDGRRAAGALGLDHSGILGVLIAGKTAG